MGTSFISFKTCPACTVPWQTCPLVRAGPDMVRSAASSVGA